MCSLFRLYGKERRTKNRERELFFVKLFLILAQEAQCDRHVALYACILPPTERIAEVGRAQLLVVWSCEITPYCKAFWRCLQAILDFRFVILDRGTTSSKIRNPKSKIVKGTTSRARRRKASLAVRPGHLPDYCGRVCISERSTSYICPPFIRSRLCGCPVPAMGDQPIDSGRRGDLAQDPFRVGYTALPEHVRCR